MESSRSTRMGNICLKHPNVFNVCLTYWVQRPNAPCLISVLLAQSWHHTLAIFSIQVSSIDNLSTSSFRSGHISKLYKNTNLKTAMNTWLLINKWMLGKHLGCLKLVNVIQAFHLHDNQLRDNYRNDKNYRLLLQQNGLAWECCILKTINIQSLSRLLFTESINAYNASDYSPKITTPLTCSDLSN